MSDRTIDPNTPLTVTLPARHLNMVLTALHEHANTVMAITQDMQRQCLAQSQPQASWPMPPPQRPNGEAAAMEE